MALCAAHREEGAVLQIERLPAHQVNDVRTDLMYLSAVPLFHRIFIQRIEVFVIAVHEQNRKRQSFQPVELRIVALATVPDASEIAADDHVVILRHLGLFRKVLRLESEAGCFREDHRLRKSSSHLLKMHLHWICVFCHFKLCFGRCPQPLTVAGLCGNQPAISNELFIRSPT